MTAKSAENINHIIYGNKDGNYAWRKYELINPVLYVSLVNLITARDSWEIICSRFKSLSFNNSISCISLPVIGDTNKKQQATQVNEWFDLIEKESIRLALDFEYLFQTDIVNCYGSVYTHSIAWALHEKSISKEKRNYNQLLGNKIDHHLQAMSNGQTNGIPQGSVLMDFIAEIVLSYADHELSKKIKLLSKDSYRILRYRDDYRIFVRNPKDGELIMKSLSEVLAKLGMALNTAKTKKSDSIITDSIKPDKLAMLKLPLSNTITKKTLRNELLTIYSIGTSHPNCGAVNIRLMRLNDTVRVTLLRNNYIEIISILINIAYENPRSFPIVAVLISKAIDKRAHESKKEVLDKLLRKINLLPNSGLLEIWLQRIAIKHSIYFLFEEKLCRNATGENLELFSSKWELPADLKKLLDDAKYIDYESIKNLDAVIDRKEVELFASHLQYE
ncbi:MAG TPA: RNA-directed DNA polymerase [Candidatus Limnocylindrales bacterium]|nr:RNA-directed DNA polymerase [Candidatus Limnocylindrales bacterium]